MKFLLLLTIISQLILSSCSSVRKSAGVTRKTLDEFQVVENPPLVIPPNFNLLPPEQLEKKNIEEIEEDLAQEILFGLEDNSVNNIDNEISAMSDILKKTEADKVDSSIREEFDKTFANEMNLICDKLGIDYDKVVEYSIYDERLGKSH